MNFKVGDKVMWDGDPSLMKPGTIGFVRVVRSSSRGTYWGVEFLGFNEGHRLEGTLQNSSGFWCYPNNTIYKIIPFKKVVKLSKFQKWVNKNAA